MVSLVRRFAAFLLVCLAPAIAGGQAVPDVTLGVTKTAYEKIDILVGTLDVLSGGMPAVEAATLLETTVARDLEYSGLFRVGLLESRAGREGLKFEFAIRGSVEGPVCDAAQTGEVEPITVSLDLVTHPGGQPMLNKRYRPLPAQLRTTAHHFANQVVEMLTGEPGIALTRIVFSRGSGDRRDLWVVDYDGEGLLRLTANRTLNLCPAWKPDGSEIAFTSYHAGMQGLFSLATATGQVRQIIAQEGHAALGIERAIFLDPTLGSIQLAVLFFVPILRHNELRLQGQHVGITRLHDDRRQNAVEIAQRTIIQNPGIAVVAVDLLRREIFGTIDCDQQLIPIRTIAV